MKNIELLNICYKFFNQYITADELIVELSTMKQKEVKSLVKEIKTIIENNNNEEDEYVKERRNKIKELISKLDNVPKSEETNIVSGLVEKLKNDLYKNFDSYDTWVKVVNCINDNEYFNNTFDSLSDYELLEFIAQNIKAPFPPSFTQEEFDRLVKVGKEKDEREYLWRLAFNYENRGINFNEIVDYYIDKKDGYYLSELISAVGSNLDIDYIVNKIKSKKLIKDLKEREDVIKTSFTDDQLNKLYSKLDET